VPLRVGEDGVGQLYVDGTAMALEVPVDIAAADYAAGFKAAPLGDKFHTHMFPSFCLQGPAKHLAQFPLPSGKKRKRRQLLGDVAGEGGGGVEGEAFGLGGVDEDFGGSHVNAWGEGPAAGSVRRKLLTVPADTDVSLTTGFYNATNYTSDFTAISFTGSVPWQQTNVAACCDFRIGNGCDGADAAWAGPIVSANFVGLVDETAVWNRDLSAAEVEYTLFKMPQGVASREIRANSGVQLDITQGHVHYGRFNNPCTEGPASIVSGSPAHDSTIRDYAAFTAGRIDPATGLPKLTDDSNDGGEVRINRSTYQVKPFYCQVKPFYLSSETVLPFK
jgi:hypothetical protein